MHRILPVFAGAILLAVGAGFASSSDGSAAAQNVIDVHQLTGAYDQIKVGMPISHIDPLGFNTAKAERLTKSILRARFMPTDAGTFNALDPAVKNCYRESEDCTAYLFDAYSSLVLVLVQDGRITWKFKYDSIVA